MTTTTTATAVRFHLSLNVSDLARSTKFFEKVFGVSPAKFRADYAKFELDSPPLVLSLTPQPPVQGGALNHVGFRFPDSAALVEVQRRLEAAGIRTQREEGVECCYARQTKFWVRDLDQTLWEFYVLEGDIGHRGAGQAFEALPSMPIVPPAELRAPSAPAVWEHFMGMPADIPSEFGSASLDEIRLRGTFNVPGSAEHTAEFLAAAHNRLRPGGTLLIHVLTAEQPLDSPPTLPGRAAGVKAVPVRTELLDAIAAAGFIDLQLTTFRGSACFEHEGTALRETQIIARRPAADCGALCTVVYKGPFAQVTDDAGRTWHRGQQTVVPHARWETIEQGPLAEHFVLLPDQQTVAACTAS